MQTHRARVLETHRAAGKQKRPKARTCTQPPSLSGEQQVAPRSAYLLLLKRWPEGHNSDSTPTFMFTLVTDMYVFRHNFPCTHVCFGYLPVFEPATNRWKARLGGTEKLLCVGPRPKCSAVQPLLASRPLLLVQASFQSTADHGQAKSPCALSLTRRTLSSAIQQPHYYSPTPTQNLCLRP